MPLRLAIDTSTRLTGLALASEGLLECRSFGPPRNAGDSLLPAIHEMLSAHGYTAANLDVIILSIGPGSFTGLRIGLSTAKGLVFGGGASLVPVSTLEVLAWQAPTRQAHVYPLMEARRGEVFTACWLRRDGTLQATEDPRRIEIAALVNELPPDSFLIGPVLLTQREAFMATEHHLALADDPDCTLSLSWLMHLGTRSFEQRGGEDPDQLEPDYLFDFQPTAGKART